MAELVAQVSFQIDSGFTRVEPGDVLPEDHPLAGLWLANGAAVLREGAPSTPVKAELACATPGLPGLAVGGEGTGEDLVGRVPVTEQRRRG